MSLMRRLSRFRMLWLRLIRSIRPPSLCASSTLIFLVGTPGLTQSNFANNFIQRPEFKLAYPDALTPAEFVNKLFDNADLIGPADTSARETAIAALTTNLKTRAQVLLDVIDIAEFKT